MERDFREIKYQNFIRYTVFVGLVMWVLVFKMNVEAAEKKVQDILEPGKIYEYNLDKKGTPEKIQVTCTEIGKKYKTIVKINGEKIYSKTTLYDNQMVMVVDTDKTDKQMELMILDGEYRDDAWCSDMKHIYYYRYEKGKAKQMQDLAPLYKKLCQYVKEIHGMSEKTPLLTNGEGNLYARVCIYLPGGYFDYQHVKVGLTFSKGKYSFPEGKKVYKLMDDPDPLLLLQDATVYTTPGGSKKSFTAKKKTEIYLLEMYRKNDKQLYFKIKDGKSGYIDPKKVKTELQGTLHA